MLLRDDSSTTINAFLPTDGGGTAGPAGTPYASGGGYSMPSVGSTFTLPTAGEIFSGRKGGTDIVNAFLPPAPSSGGGGSTSHAPATASDVTPSIPFISASGTPTATPATGPASDGTTTVPATSPDYFHDVLDLITAQLTTGQPAATQQFSATPVALPSGSYAGSDGSSGASGGAAGGVTAGRPWLGLVVLLALAGGAYYWFIWRKKHRSGGGGA